MALFQREIRDMNVRFLKLLMLAIAVVIGGLISLFTIDRFGTGALIGLIAGGVLNRMIPYHKLFG